VIDGTVLVLAGVLAGLAFLAWRQGGSELVWRGLGSGGNQLVRYGLVIALSFLAAGFAEVLIPTHWIRETFGEGSGLRGIVVASAVGIVTPAGPFVSMPIAAAMIRSGAGAGPVVAFLVGWALLALHRFLAWEVPILGLRLAALRYAVCLALPPLAGLAARIIAR
jgi:uncharacterized membrane protein YraQ (UPF0718 family)